MSARLMKTNNTNFEFFPDPDKETRAVATLTKLELKRLFHRT